MEKIIIIGATAEIAKQCAMIWLDESPKELLLVGRNEEKLARQAENLNIRYPDSNITSATVNFNDHALIKKFIEDLYVKDSYDLVLIAHGVYINQQQAQENLALCYQSLYINALSPIFFAESFAHCMQNKGHGKIAIISSVAGDRGRKSNYIYGAAKALLSTYAEGLQHRLYHLPVKIIVIKPGPTLSPFTEHLLHSKIKLAKASLVATDIVRGIKKSSPVIYTPKKWRIIMWIIRMLPKKIFYRLNI